MSSEAASLAKRVLEGDRRALAKAITLFEGQLPEQRRAAAELLAALTQNGKRDSLRVAVSGPPGVGKSTFIERLGNHLIKSGRRVAVLAIDPSSPVSGGSILGDRVRMEELSRNEMAFIRPSPAGKTLGGAARHTREAIIACEAAGYGVVIVETVGVGQSEVVAASMVDAFLVLAQPHAGDEIQGLKKGLFEMADLVAVTKADGATLTAARLAAAQLHGALSSSQRQGGAAPVHLVSSLEGPSVELLWSVLEKDLAAKKASGALAARRSTQAVDWFREELGAILTERIAERADLATMIKGFESKVASGQLPASVAAAEAIDSVLAPPSAGSSTTKGGKR